MVNIFSSPPFYTNHVRLLNANDQVPPEIQQNPNSGHISKMPWVQLMGVTLILPPLHHFVMYTKITKASSPKTAFLHAYFLFNFAMPSLDGKVLPLMLKYGMMPLIMILSCQKVNIILQMQVILLAISCWFHTEVYATILHSGVGPMCSMWYFFKQNTK